jgi:hypothetical protein
MKRKQVGHLPGGEALAVYNSGASRSRITLVTAGERPSDPLQLAGTRWILFGDQAAAALHLLILENSYLKLDDLIPGGFSSSTWQAMRAHWKLLPPESSPQGSLHFLTFGQYNTRVILLRAGDAFAPHRIEGTSVVALSPRALRLYAEFLASLPGDSAAAYRRTIDLVPGGLTPTTILRSRRALSS